MLAGLVPSEGVKENLFQASPLASGASLAVFGIYWLVEASPPSLPSSSLDILPARVSVSKFPLFIRTPVVTS